VKRSLFVKERRSPQSIAISLAVHALVVAGLASITWYYPIGSLIGLRIPKPVEERVVYVRPSTAAPEGSRASRPRGSTRVSPTAPVPVPLPAPTSIPVGIPTPPPQTAPTTATPGVPGGSGGTGTRAAIGPTTGVEPAIADPRISLQPTPYGAVPKTQAQLNDSALTAIYTGYRDSVIAAKANPDRKPGDWTIDRGNGQKWGWDSEGIRLGKFTVPNAILAAIQTGIGPQGRSINALTDARMNSWTQRDLWEHSQTMSTEDFKTAVKRIRERVDREKAAETKKVVVDTKKVPK
jgi:hypothetical protein